MLESVIFFFFSSRRRHTRLQGDWSSDVCSSDLRDESFSHGLLEYPQYTRPAEFRGMKVPEVLLSGNHAQIDRWRREQARQRTTEQRTDLLKKRSDELME